MGRAWVTVDGQAGPANRLPRDADGRAYLDLSTGPAEAPFQTPLAGGLAYGEHRVVLEVAPTGAPVAVDGVVVYSGRAHVVQMAMAGLLVAGVTAALVLALRRLDVAG